MIKKLKKIIAYKRRNKIEVNRFLTYVLSGLLIFNVVVMIIFTAIINMKLNDALELSKPVVGTFTLVEKEDCSKCRNLDEFKKYITTQNVEVEEENKFASDSEEGKAIIKKFKISSLPVLIFEDEEKITNRFQTSIKVPSQKSGKNILIWEKVAAPYFDLEENRIVGLVDVVFLVDKSCPNCANTMQIYGPVFKTFGIAVNSERSIDVSSEEGKSLVSKYNVTNVPAAILSTEAKYYKELIAIWDQVGTVESEGSLVFRELSKLKVKYKDLKTGKINS